MASRHTSPDNVPFEEWVDQPDRTTLEEWEPTAKQLGWSVEAGTQNDMPNLEYDGYWGFEEDAEEENEEEPEELTDSEKAMISTFCNKVRSGKDGNGLVPRTKYPHKTDAALTTVGEERELEVDRNTKTAVENERIELHNPDIASVQDDDVEALEQEDAARILCSMSKQHWQAPLMAASESDAEADAEADEGMHANPNTGSDKKSNAKSTESMSPENLQRLLASEFVPEKLKDNHGILVGKETLNVDGSQFDTFSDYVMAASSGLNPRNCRAALAMEVLEAANAKEQQLLKEGKIDHHGRPVYAGGYLYPNDRNKAILMQRWFQEAVADVEGLELKKPRNPRNRPTLAFKGESVSKVRERKVKQAPNPTPKRSKLNSAASRKSKSPSKDSGSRHCRRSTELAGEPSNEDSGSANSDSSLTDMTSNPNDDMDIDEPDNAAEQSSVSDFQPEDYASERSAEDRLAL